MTFQLFIPDKQLRHINEDQVIFALWISYVVVFWGLGELLFPKDSQAGLLCGIVLGFITLFFLVASFFRYQPLRGTLTGDIEFTMEGIRVNGTFYPLTDITAIDFFINDYYGNNASLAQTLTPRLSQGVNNYVTFTDAGGQEHQYHFKLFSANGRRELDPVISMATAEGKLSLLRGVELLDINNYDEIQQFKARHFKEGDR